LRGADLRGADLRGADLRGVKLMQSKLWGADFRGANLPDGCMISENEDFYGPGGGLMARVKNR